MPTIAALLSTNPLNTDSARLDVELLIMHVLNCPRSKLYSHPDYQLTDDELHLFNTLLMERQQGVPMAYLTGKQSFWSLDLKVTSDTLIPRPETELLVELALNLMPSDQIVRALDLGTGSGAIALSILHERPHWQVIAVDQSDKALAIARDNAVNLGLSSIDFRRSNWFSALTDLKFDLIISNPPYIASDDPHLINTPIQFEPQTALVSGDDGLLDLRYIIKHASHFLMPGGLLLLEHGYQQSEAVQALLKTNDYESIQSWRDLQGHNRVTGGVYKE
jgi:release factor glutamine methyltransferase